MATDDVAIPTQPVSVGTLLRFLVGSREAILRVASCRQALWLGLVFVLSTGFAREYDGADLWHESWHLLLPLAASLGTSFVLYCLVCLAAVPHGVDELRFWRGYRTLLTLYWFTAPLAWLYAIPVERFLSAGDATAANLWFLAAVSVWRVLLITRALSVWLNASFVVIFFLVMFFADSVAIALAFVTPKPIFNIMGGVRLSEPDQVLVDAVLMVQVFGMMSWLVWLIGAIVALSVIKKPWTVTAEPAPCRVSKPLWATATALVVLGLALLPIGQPEQRRAYTAERLLKSNQLEAAVNYMSAFPREAFPPIWDPPPRVGYGEKEPDIMEVLSMMIRYDATRWMGQLYIDKLSQNPLEAFQDALPDADTGTAQFEGLMSAYEKFVPVDSLNRQQWEELYGIADNPKLDLALRKRLTDYLSARENR